MQKITLASPATANKKLEQRVFLNINTQAAKIDLDLQTRLSKELKNTSSSWISRKSVQQCPRHLPKTSFLSMVSLTFDVDIQTHLSEEPITSCSWIERKSVHQFPETFHTQTRMWANAQTDGRPAEHRWRPLFNAAKFGWRPLLDAVH